MADELTPSAAPASLRALRAALGQTSAWSVVWILHLLLAAAPALATYAWFRDATLHRYPPGEVFANLGTAFRADHRAALAALDLANARAGAVLALIAMLVSAFCAGGWLQVFLEQAPRRSLQRFFLGGGRYFLRFVRVLLLSLLVLALVGWAVYGWPWEKVVLEWLLGLPKAEREGLAGLPTELAALRLTWLQHGLFALLFGLVLVWGDYTRTRLALHDTSSAVWSGLCTFFVLLRHPVRVLRPALVLLAAEALVVLGAGLVASSIEDGLSARPELLASGLLLLAGQLALAWRVIVRGARYHAAVEVSRAIVRPIARPDPWKQSLGGPGGPRYPLGDDEYATSI